MKKIKDVSIELHADDYGETPNISKRILDHMKEGNLDGISILTNFSCFDECADMIRKAIPELPFLPYMSIHVDVVEGRMLSDPEHLIPWTWKDLFLATYHIPVKGPDGTKLGYKDTFKILKKEIAAQLAKGKAFTDELQKIASEAGVEYDPQNLRIDSHQHSHMLPIVWKALTEAIAEGGYKLDYIRNSHEPLNVFMKHKGDLIPTIYGQESEFGSRVGWKPVNILKNRILTFYSPAVERYLNKAGIKPMYAFGLVMSGGLDTPRISLVMPDMIRLCEEKGRNVELVIHPGKMLESELNPEVPKESAYDFLLDEGRDIESATVSVFHRYVDEYLAGK